MTTLYETSTPNAAGHHDVGPQQVLAARATTRIVDVREPHEFRGDLGHIEGAELVPLTSIASAASRWSKDEPIVFICRSGRRSERAASTLAAAGFGRVMNMVGGMLAWSAARLPVVDATR